jgi:hypothetical protein
MSALGSLVVKLALEHAEFTKGISQSDQAALKFAKNTQDKFDQVDRKTKQFFSNFAAGALGAVASIAGINNAVTKFNAAVDTLADLSALSQRTGIAVETLSQLDRVIRDTGGSMEQTVVGIEKLSQGMSRIEGPSNRVLNALDAIDVQTRNMDGTLRDSGDVFVDLSKRLAEFEDGASKTALVMDIFGESGAKLLPVMNNVAARIDDTAVSSTEAALQAEAYNNAMGTLGRRFDDIFTTVASHLLPSLLNITEAMSTSGKATSGFSKAGAVLSEVLKGLAVSAVTIGGTFKLLGEQIGGRAAQLVALGKLDFTGAAQIGDELSKSMVRIRDEVGDTIDTILGADQEIAEAIERTGKKQLEFTSGAADGTDRLTGAIKGLNREAEKEVNTLAARGRALTLSLDPLARYNSEVEELVQLLGAGAISQRIFDLELNNAKARFDEATGAVEKVNDKLVETKDTAQRVFDDVSQFAVQGARNIQTALSDALLEGINGFNNFADSALNIIKRLAANIASVKILEGLGVGSLFGLGSSSAFASGGSGGFSLSGLGSSAFDLVNSGFGASSLFNSFATSGIGQNLGLSVTGPVADFGQLTSLGSSIGTGLATAGAGAIGIGIGSALAGDKKVFGVGGTATSAIGAGIGAAVGGPIGAALGGILGGGISALFGRGPLKQKDSLIRGTITEQGIGDDFLTATNFKAKGGVLRGDKVDRVIINANTGELVNGAPGLPESGISKSLLPFADEAAKQAIQIGQIFDQAIKGFDASLRQAGESLGIGSSQLDNFQRWIQLTTTSAEGITETQVAEEMQNIGNHMANVLLPGLQSMRKEGETATQALSRIVTEFNSLENALSVLGVSSADAEAAVKGLSIAARTELIDAAGGVDAFNQQISFFASNFLSAEEQLEISFNALDAEMKKVGLSADISREEFADLIKTVTQAGGITTDTATALLRLAPAFDQVKNAEAALAAKSEAAAPAVDSLTGSVGRLDDAARSAAEIANTVQSSFARIDAARDAVDAAEKQLAVARARRTLSQAQDRLSIANTALAQAQSDLAAARSAEQATQRSNLSNQIDAINEAISERGELISLYQEEASALKGVVDRFGALSDKIIEFKDSLQLSNLSPFSPGEQLAIARQQFNQTRNLAAQGDEQALAKLPEVSRDFLEASKVFNGATGAFESDFNFVQQVLESSGATARATRDIAADQLAGIESTIKSLQILNDAAQDQVKALNDIGSQIGNVDDNIISVDQALSNLASAEQDQLIAEQQVRDANRVLEAEMFKQNGFIDDVGQATIQVRDAVEELGDAILQGFGNAFVRDQQIRDFVLANPNQPDSFFAQAAIDAGLSGSQVTRALQQFGVTPERVNKAFNGDSVRSDQISSLVDQKLAEDDFIGIYNAARANGITSDRLAAESQLSKEQINQFVSANNLQPFKTGTDFVRRDGIAMLHKGEAVVPSSTTQEIKALRQELAQLRREQNQQMSALINTNIQANADNARAIAKSNERLAANANWQQRSRPKVA